MRLVNPSILWALGTCLMIPLLIIQPHTVKADITEIGPFVGTHSEDYTIPGIAFQELEVMGGLARLTNLTSGGAIKIEMTSQFNGDLIVPRSNPTMMGQLGILRWDFRLPVHQFGSYFENNSGTDNAVIQFFDEQDVLLDTREVITSASSQQWMWNGWESDTPISSMIVTGNSSRFLNGFIWYDDSQATIASVPEPIAGVFGSMLCLFATGLRRRRRHDVPVTDI